MYNSDVDVPKEELNSAIVQELRLLGLKHGSIPKRINKSNQSSKYQSNRGCIFRKPLALLSSRIVQLQSGVDAEVPNIIQEICCCIVQQAGVEGLFRKAGSAVRQKEIRALLDQGHKVQFLHHHVIDVANILKCFLRELAEPVLPFAFHELFLHCLLLDDSVAAILLVCLLLPRPHLHVLAYLMEFFHLISGLAEANKMTISNIAIVIAPSLMPVSEKISVVQNPQRINGHVRIIEVLIKNAERIGVLPDGVVGKLSLTPSVSNISLLSDDHSGASFSSKKKRRRSGSLTRMFNGLKKIVAGKPSPGVDSEYSSLGEEVALVPSITDFSTPCVKSAKKRKAVDASSAFSSKKKRDVLMALPQSTTLADTPFKKAPNGYNRDSNETPRVCPHPNPASNQKNKSKSPQKIKNRKFFPTRTFSESDSRKPTAKKGLSGVSNFVIKKQKQRAERHSTSGNFLERSWSAVSSSHWGRKKSRQSDQTRLSVASTSSAYVPMDSDSSHDADIDIGIDLSSQEDPFDPSPNDFVHVPKSEYEELKTRMSAIESCITQEFNSMSAPVINKSSPEKMNAAKTLQAVQTVYEKTLEGADIAKDVSTDQLAKRLSRELKIRRSVENRVIRSPSARKIGTIRRRSRERQSPSLRRELRRNKSWHMMQRPANVVALCRTAPSPETSAAQNNRLRRGRPNTVFSGLPHPTPTRVTKETRCDDIIPILGADNSPATRSQTRRASSFHGSEPSSPALPSSKKCRSQVNLAKAALLAHAQQKCKGNLEFDEKWRDAQELLSSSKDLLSGLPTTGRESIAKLRSENAGKVLATAKMFSASNEAPKPVEGRRSRVHETMPVRASLGGNQGESPCVKHEVSLSGNHETVEKSIKPISDVSKVHAPVLCNISTSVQKMNNDRSSPVRPSNRRLHLKSSPTQSPTVRTSKVKKHSSMKVDRVAHSQPVRRNLSVPVQLIDSGKENQVGESLHNASNFPRGLSPQLSKETVPLTDRIQRISVSPLKDCNRISVQPAQGMKYASITPCSTPNIKQPLRVLTPRQKSFTPQRVCAGNTPLKVMPTSAFTPKHSAQQRQHLTRIHAAKAIKLARTYN